MTRLTATSPRRLPGPPVFRCSAQPWICAATSWRPERRPTAATATLSHLRGSTRAADRDVRRVLP